MLNFYTFWQSIFAVRLTRPIAGNGICGVLVFKIFRGSMPPDPPSKLAAPPLGVACGAPKHDTVRFQAGSAPVLEEKDLWNVVKGDEVEPTEEGTTETQRRQFQKRERKALATICLSLGDEQLSLVRTATTAKEAWSKLQSHYEVKSQANKLFLRKKYFTMSMGVDDSMSEHINKMKELARQVEAVDASITEGDQVATLLCSLPESYNSLIIALESFADDLKLEFVTARLLHEEHKRKENSLTSDTGDKALLSKHDRTNQKSF